MEETKYPIDEFLAEIHSRREDRGYLSKLKRGLSAATEDQSWSILACQGFRFSDPVKRKIWQTIGALGALLEQNNLMEVKGWANLGDVLRALAWESGGDSESVARTYDAKLRRLLDCPEVEELCDFVVGICRMAATKGVPVNLRQLYFDLNGWDDPIRREKTRVNWAAQFYRKQSCVDGSGEVSS